MYSDIALQVAIKFNELPAEMGSRGNPLQVYQQFFRKKNILV